MKLHVVLPRFSPAINEVVVVKWHKVVGDTVSYGDALCDVVVQEVTRMRRPISALSRKKDQPKFGTMGVRVPYRLTTLDAGSVSAIAAAEGETVAVGALMAELQAEGGEGEGEARSVVNLIENEEGDE